MTRILRWAVMTVMLAGLCTALFGAMFLLFQCAGWFAMGDLCPPFPWLLLKFFWFVGWCISPFLALSIPVSAPHGGDVG